MALLTDTALAERHPAPQADPRDHVESDHGERVELNGATPVDEAWEAIDGAPVVAIRFNAFNDGRGFSLAASLRARGYTGRLIAVGPLLPDQVGFLRRTGFDDIQSEAHQNSSRWTGDKGFSARYQPSRDGGRTAFQERASAARRAQVETLNAQLKDASPQEILAAAIAAFSGRIAMLSSFGAEAAAGLALVAEVDPATPVLFLDTKRHFPQTLSYKDRLVSKLGLTNVITLEPDPADEARLDPDETLYERDGLACCDIRKVKPLARGLNGYGALITGRKRYHGGDRAALQPFEFDGERVKVNPFALLSPEAFTALFQGYDLPAHPMVEQGYPSIGCWPCTAPAQGETGARAGRWAGQDRSECGIFDPKRAERAEQARRNVRQLI